MTRDQRFRYEMFIRVRDFGVANRDRFPASSAGGEMLAEVAAIVKAIEEHLTRRIVARTEARRVKTTTRRSVIRYMQALAATGRRVATIESSPSPFRMPESMSAASVLSAARLFIDEAEKRQPQFVRFGLPEGFVAAFKTLVNELDTATRAQLNSRSGRRRAQAGIEAGFADGMNVIRHLDVIVANVMRDDRVSLAGWRGARHIEGVGRGLHRTVKPQAPDIGTASGAPAISAVRRAGYAS